MFRVCIALKVFVFHSFSAFSLGQPHRQHQLR